MKYKYNAFLSYSWANREIAEKIVIDLEDSTKIFNVIPRIKIFRDQIDAEQKKGLAEMNKGMDESEYLIILASTASAKSDAVGDEIVRWIKNNRSLENIIIVLLESKIELKKEIVIDKNIFKLKSDSLNPKLEEIEYNIEPIWVNMSKIENLLSQTRKAGFYRANLIEIVARILNTTSRQIENKESRARRILFGGLITIASILLMLSIYAFVQKDIADKQTVEAQRQRDKANKQTQIAQKRLQDYDFKRLEEALRNGQVFIDAETRQRAKAELDTARKILVAYDKVAIFNQKKNEFRTLQSSFDKTK